MKLCLGRLVDEHVMQGESREAAYKSLRSVLTHPNLQRIRPQVVIDLLDEVSANIMEKYLHS